MKAQVLRTASDIHSRPLSLEDVAAPEPEDDQVRIKVRCCAVCRTDLHIIEEDLPPMKRPVVPGHQIVGVIDRVGASCRRLSVGQRVGVAWLRHTCGDCHACASGRENLCDQSRYTGYHDDGGYAEYAVVGEKFAYEIPAVFEDAAAAPLLCAGLIGYRSLQRSRVPEGGRLGLVCQACFST